VLLGARPGSGGHRGRKGCYELRERVGVRPGQLSQGFVNAGSARAGAPATAQGPSGALGLSETRRQGDRNEKSVRDSCERGGSVHRELAIGEHTSAGTVPAPQLVGTNGGKVRA